jgi:hypothetical protein
MVFQLTRFPKWDTVLETLTALTPWGLYPRVLFCRRQPPWGLISIRPAAHLAEDPPDVHARPARPRFGSACA